MREAGKCSMRLCVRQLVRGFQVLIQELLLLENQRQLILTQVHRLSLDSTVLLS